MSNDAECICAIASSMNEGTLSKLSHAYMVRIAMEAYPDVPKKDWPLIFDVAYEAFVSSNSDTELSHFIMAICRVVFRQKACTLEELKNLNGNRLNEIIDETEEKG